MKKLVLLLLLSLTTVFDSFAQYIKLSEGQRKNISYLIDQYSRARETKDTSLLKTILTEDVDQLVSTGEWRNGLNASVQGMLKSSAEKPGTRSLTVDKIKMLTASTAIADCRYEIQNTDSTIRKMWSTFIMVAPKDSWKISAIRNMLPASP